MIKKIKGGISYKFDIVTIGRISVERDHNRNLYLDEAGVSLITELNAFAHSFDFQSDASVFKNTNASKIHIAGNLTLGFTMMFRVQDEQPCHALACSNLKNTW